VLLVSKWLHGNQIPIKILPDTAAINKNENHETDLRAQSARIAWLKF